MSLKKTEQPLILVVDDVPSNTMVLAAMLHKDYRVKVAGDGELALRLAHEAGKPDLILLDLNMPVMDGAEVLRRLRADTATSDIPVIIVTGDISEASEVECLDLGANDFLTKPVRVPSLQLRVRNLLRQHQLERQLAARAKSAEMTARKGERKYRRLFMGMAQGVVYHDAQGKIVDANPAACKILGLSMAQLLGKDSMDPHWRCIHEDGADFPGETHPAMVALATGHPVHNVVMGVWNPAQNRHLWMLVDALPLFEAGNTEPSEVHTTFTDITESRVALQALQQERSFNEAIVESSGGVLVVLDRNGHIVRANRSVERLTGFTRAELLGQPIWDWLIPPERMAGVQAVFADLQAHARPSEYENDWITRDGWRVFFHWYNTVLLDAQGQVSHVIAQGHEITARLRAENELRQSVEQQTALRALQEIVLSGESLQTTFAHFMAHLLSISWLQLLPKGGIFVMNSDGTGLQLVTSHDLPSLCAKVSLGHCLCGRAAASGATQFAAHLDERHEIRYPGMDDLGHYCLPLSKDGKVWGVLCLYLAAGRQHDSVHKSFLHDVGDVLTGYHARWQAEQELIAHQEHLEDLVDSRTSELTNSQRKLEAIIDNLPAIFFSKDGAGRYTRVNHQYEKGAGKSREQVIGHTDRDIFSADVADAVMYMDHQVRACKMPITFEESRPHADGTWHDYLITKAPLIDTEGNVSELIGIATDITPIKRMQEELGQAVAEAQRLARVKSEFLANMSHEIRTPLNGILGLAQVGQRENIGRRSQRLFNQLVDSGQLLLGIVNDILDYSKIEAGKMSVEVGDVELDRVVQHVLTMCSDRASTMGLTLRVEVDEALPAWFRGDPLRIAQILINLVGNAIKFTEAGEVVLSIAREAEHLLFRVRDSGIGMSPEHVANLFQPFEQADGSITRRFGGTGLGLAITKRLTDLMAGEIRVDSELGVGSTFEVRLPLQGVDAPLKSALYPHLVPPLPGSHPLAGLRILVAEDNPVNRMVLEDMLVMEGATLLCVEDGQQALDILLREGDMAWDILLTDIHMPVMGGHELAQKLRDIAPSLPIVGVTAHAMAEEQQRCLESGMVAHVAKPIVMAELVAVVSRHARRGARDVGPPTAVPPVLEKGLPAVTPTVTPDASEAAIAPSSVGAPPEIRPTEDFIDFAALLTQFQNRQDFVDKLLRSALDSHGDTPAKLRAAAQAADLAALAFTAHSFATVAGTLHAVALHTYTKQVEKKARDGNAEAITQAAALAGMIERFLATIREKLG